MYKKFCKSRKVITFLIICILLTQFCIISCIIFFMILKAWIKARQIMAVDPVHEGKNLKNLETIFFETILYAKLGRKSQTNRIGRRIIQTNRIVNELRIIANRIMFYQSHRMMGITHSYAALFPQHFAKTNGVDNNTVSISNTDCQKMATDIIICFKIYEGTIRPRLLEAKRLKKIQ